MVEERPSKYSRVVYSSGGDPRYVDQEKDQVDKEESCTQFSLAPKLEWTTADEDRDTSGAHIDCEEAERVRGELALLLDELLATRTSILGTHFHVHPSQRAFQSSAIVVVSSTSFSLSC